MYRMNRIGRPDQNPISRRSYGHTLRENILFILSILLNNAHRHSNTKGVFYYFVRRWQLAGQLAVGLKQYLNRRIGCRHLDLSRQSAFYLWQVVMRSAIKGVASQKYLGRRDIADIYYIQQTVVYFCIGS